MAGAGEVRLRVDRPEDRVVGDPVVEPADERLEERHPAGGVVEARLVGHARESTDESKRPARWQAVGRPGSGVFGCSSVVLQLSDARRSSGGFWQSSEIWRQATEGSRVGMRQSVLGRDGAVRRSPVLLGPGGEERGAALGDDPGVLAGTTLDEAPATAPVHCLVA